MTRDQPSALDPMLCFAVYSLERRITRIYRELLEPLGLSYTQHLVLTVLLASDEPRTVGELGTDLDLDSGTLSPLLRRLERRGLVTRERRAGGDERVVSVALTDAGRAMRPAIDDVRSCLGDRMQLDETEVAGLMTNLRTANERLRDAAAT